MVAASGAWGHVLDSLDLLSTSEGDMVKNDTSELAYGGVVRVSVPAAIARDLKRMHVITEEVLGRLGCGQCHSGFDIRFDIEREFFVNLDGKLMGPGGR
jgi:hypothetical protein